MTTMHTIIEMYDEDVVVRSDMEAPTQNVTAVNEHHHGARHTKTGRKKKMKKPKRAKTTLKRFADFAFPRIINNFLFEETDVFQKSKFFFGFGFGGLIGFVIYLLMIDPLKLPDWIKISILYFLTVICASGWGLSTYFRCTTLIIVPNVLGKEGRACLLIIALAAIYAGPGANLKHNFTEIPRSIGCTAELQINNTKMLWKILSTPVKNILKNVMQKTGDFKGLGEDVKTEFKEPKEAVEGKSGYNVKKEEELYRKIKVDTTQQKFDIKSMLRCEYVIGLGITKCEEWFATKHADCMRTIAVPLINHVLCLPLQFSFLCGILNIGDAWCKKYIPMNGNFGETYDKLSSVVSNVGSSISSKLIKEKEDDVGAGENVTKIDIKDSIYIAVERRSVILESIANVLKHIAAITFIYIFFSAFMYTTRYNSDIRYDNCYVTTYFRQIDARRRKQKKRYLLPMKKGETSKFIFPFSPKIQGPEVSSMMTELRQCIFPIVTFTILVMFDRILYHVLDIIRRHSNISYVFASHHKLEVGVDGDSMLANLLRRTIGLLNSSSNTFETSSNEMCLPKPTALTGLDYVVTCLPILAMLFMSVFQVYFYRLRRVVASYYFPQREKRRVLFLYNEQLRKRATYAHVKRKQIMSKARINRKNLKTTMGTLYQKCKFLRKFIRRHCIVCDQSETKNSFVCPKPDCGTVYCRQCWRDMKKFCYACTPYEDFILGPDYSDSEQGSD